MGLRGEEIEQKLHLVGKFILLVIIEILYLSTVVPVDKEYPCERHVDKTHGGPSGLPEKFSNLTFFDRIKIEDKIEIKFDYDGFADRYKDYFDFEHDKRNWTGMSGSFVPLPNHPGYYFHTTRVIQIRCDVDREEDGFIRAGCGLEPYRSLIYADILNSEFKQEPSFVYQNNEYPRIVGVYSPDLNKEAGPEDARSYVDLWGNLNLIFNMMDVDSKRVMWTYNITTAVLRKLNMENRDVWQKNWSPIFKDGRPLFITSLQTPQNPYICPGFDGKCKPFNEGGSTEIVIGVVRAGSPFYVYKGYYVGLARFRIQPEPDKFPYYRPQLAVLDPDLKLIFISEPTSFGDILFRQPFMHYGPDDHVSLFERSILTPMSFFPIEDGLWAAEFNVFDQKNVILKVSGVEEFLDDLIKKYKKKGSSEKVYQDAEQVAIQYLKQILQNP